MGILEYIVLTIIALGPSIFWVWFFLRYDWQRPEPPILIITVFIWGLLIGFPIVFLEKSSTFYFLSQFRTNEILFIVLKAFLIAGFVEESLKFLVIKMKVYKHSAFDEPLDGIIYCITAALGLAAFENLAAIFTQGTTAVFSRFATTTLMHALTAGIMGYFIGLAKFKPHREKIFLVCGLFLAIVLHGLYNIIASFYSITAIVLLIVFLIVIYGVLIALIRKIKKFQSIKLKQFIPKRQ